MKNSTFITIVIVVAAVASWVIFTYLLPEYVRAGGPLVMVLIGLFLMVMTFVVERYLSLKKAEGKGDLGKFLHEVKNRLAEGDTEGAMQACDNQRSTLASVIRAGLERYSALRQENRLDAEQQLAETQRAMEEATMLEMPALEKNLVALSTIASIATMVGLLGTTLGMIKSFQAMQSGGAPDAGQLARGISEALINTAGGLVAAIIAIVAYNYFMTKIDNFTYLIDEGAYLLVQTLTTRRAQESAGAMPRAAAQAAVMPRQPLS